jgi:hypothetical protein
MDRLELGEMDLPVWDDLDLPGWDGLDLLVWGETDRLEAAEGVCICCRVLRVWICLCGVTWVGLCGMTWIGLCGMQWVRLGWMTWVTWCTMRICRLIRGFYWMRRMTILKRLLLIWTTIRTRRVVGRLVLWCLRKLRRRDNPTRVCICGLWCRCTISHMDMGLLVIMKYWLLWAIHMWRRWSDHGWHAFDVLPCKV